MLIFDDPVIYDEIENVNSRPGYIKEIQLQKKTIWKSFKLQRRDIENCELMSLLVQRMRLNEISVFKMRRPHYIRAINEHFNIQAKD